MNNKYNTYDHFDKLRCYDGKGQVILEGIEAYFISEQRMYSNGYLMINYIDEEGS